MRFKIGTLNALSLVAIQGANALFPLLVFPYLLSVIGEESFAIIVTAEALAFYALTVCLYSFDTSGVQSVINVRKTGERILEASCVFNIFATRIVLFLLSSFVLVGVASFLSNSSLQVLLVWMLFVLGTILQSNFYFQAIEDNFALASCIIVSRIIGVVGVYCFVNGPEDLLLASSLLAGSYFISGVAGFLLLLTRFDVSAFRTIRIAKIYTLLQDGRYIFFGNLSVSFFRGANVLILSELSNAAAVSTYAIAEKVIKSIQALARPLNQIFAPKAAKAWSDLDKESRTEKQALILLWRNTRIQVWLMLAVMPVAVSAIYLGSYFELLNGFDSHVVALIALMSPAVCFGVANAMFGPVGLSLIGAQSYFAKSVLLIGVLAFTVSMIVSYLFGAPGAGSAFVMAEFCLLVAFVIRYRRRSATHFLGV
ncbi:oligosaccharide flippase family protein [Pseudomonas sp. M2]|uniref:oligosaccharide flippase family protein n=1 Tax=Pseudomonas sp. M2 TaxID=228756 RepID=UPI0018CA3AE7|nr:oligosaccharide flippase family protein [Pseudomonas sp. M2]MBG6124162.1 PST family polysaccharide transporter [Pseudomonas sp. M2]HDS1748007.1 oligosaccharide flippase family protein [Pseudomonas putida]